MNNRQGESTANLWQKHIEEEQERRFKIVLRDGRVITSTLEMMSCCNHKTDLEQTSVIRWRKQWYLNKKPISRGEYFELMGNRINVI